MKWLKVITLTAYCFLAAQLYAEANRSPSFDGFYVGGNVGFVHFKNLFLDRDDYLTFVSLPNALENSDINWLAGIQAGYDWSYCHWLFGLVADWDWTNAKVKNSLLKSNPTIITISSEIRLHWLSTIRGRTGILFDSFLFYFTAGAAAAHFKTHLSNNQPLSFPVNERFSFERNRWGWTAGFGAEWLAGCHLSLNAELLYASFDSYRFKIFSPAAANTFSFSSTNDIWLGRIGLNYRFSLRSFL